MVDVRWGIIGCGDVVARKSGRAFARIEGSELVAVMRRSQEAADRVAQELRAGFATDDVDALINHPEVTVVYIASPPSTHRDFALKVAEAGKPLLIEKPVGRSAAEFQEIVSAFRDRGIPLFVSYYRPHLPKFKRVKEILDAGILGEISAIQYRFRGQHRSNNWRVDPHVCGGGMFWDLGGHVLDLLDGWFGPLSLDSGHAASLMQTHDSEDTVSLNFHIGESVSGTAFWNFASRLRSEVLEIEGRLGRLTLEDINPHSGITLDLFRDEEQERRLKPLQRRMGDIARRLRRQNRRYERSTETFEKVNLVHEPMIRSIVSELRDGTAGVGNSEAALRTSWIMDSALDDYYGGRQNSFWERPSTWNSAWIQSVWRSWKTTRALPEYALSEDHIRFFIENGYLGPFKCDAPELDHIDIPQRGAGLNLHLDDEKLAAVCRHPSVVDRIAPLLGSSEVKLFKTRFWVKKPEVGKPVPWHQDVGDNNGGYSADGSPVTTLTLWMAIDAATRENGAVSVLPGTHRRFFGHWRENLQNCFPDADSMKEVKRDEARLIEVGPGEFYIFHSWLLHSSGPNLAKARRAALNMRFVAPGHEVEKKFTYLTVREGDEGEQEPKRIGELDAAE